MKTLVTAGLSVAIVALAGTAAFAQTQYAPPPPDSYGSGQYQGVAPAYNPNVQSYQDYQGAMSAYDAARDTAARQSDAYNQSSADYQANREAYRRQMRAYQRARADYDEEYGAGAYERYYAPPPPPPY